MNWLTEDQKNEIRWICASHPERECCGFVCDGGAVIDVVNQAHDPTDAFLIDAKEFAKHDIEHGVKGIWHSHIEEGSFSEADQVGIYQSQLPWAIYVVKSGKFVECDPTPGSKAPLEGRPFVYGVYDCYSLVQDKWAEMGLYCPDWERGEWGEWNTPEFKPFDVEGIKWGRPIRDGDQQEGDVILFNLGDHHGHTDHVGVFVDRKHFAHHLVDRPSRIDPWASYWKDRTRLILRART